MKRSIFLPVLFVMIACQLCSAAAEDDWLTYYYVKPQPERFVEEVLKMSGQGLLSRQGGSLNIACFLSRIMASSPSSIAGWMSKLNKLPQEQKDVLAYAVWISNTAEGRGYLIKHGYRALAGEKPIDVLSLQPDKTEILDMLWCYFFAPGEKAPVRRLVKALEYEKFSGSIDKAKGLNKSEEVQKDAYLEAVYRAALWSLESNLKQHPRLVDICDEFVIAGDLSQPEKLWLSLVMAKALPDKYRMIHEKEGSWRFEKLKPRRPPTP